MSELDVVNKLQKTIETSNDTMQELIGTIKRQKVKIAQLESMLSMKQEELDISEQINKDLGDKNKQLEIELSGQAGLGDK